MADVVDAIQVLVSPSTSSSADAMSFDQLFAANIRNLRQMILRSPPLSVLTDRLTLDAGTEQYEVCWHFVECIIELLHVLCKTLSETTKKCDTLSHGHVHGCVRTSSETSAPPLSSDALSLVQRKTVSSALQFVSGFGICPLLLPGVGIPLHRRSELACKLVTEDIASGVSDCDKYYRLTACVDILLSCFKQEALASIILSTHLCDLLASTMQVCYSPLWKTFAAEFEETKSCRVNPCLAHSHKDYMDELTKLTSQIPSSSLLRELLLLQSGCPPSPNMKVHGFYIFTII